MEINRHLGQPDYPATPVMNARLKRVPGGEAIYKVVTVDFDLLRAFYRYF